ncbi:hypothetical protein DBR11_29295 [Pedobacter sp. HMWF019]|nr:hypothetical protein DBR11_29295 [Pedobacter sp. HMWF019]
MDLARKLNSKNYPLLEFSLKQFKNFVQKDTINESSLLIKSEKQINQELLFRLSNYNNGILQFSKPESINSTINSATFKEYFAKFIGEELMPEPKPDKSPFKNIIKKKLYDPLKDKIDVDFTLEKKQLETLFFDFHLDGIGVNGSIYAAKAIDFNSKRQLGQIRNDISDFESVIERLNIFAKSKGLSNHHQYCLIIDSYQGNSPSYLDLYSLLKEDNMPLFKILSSNEMNRFVSQVIDNKARKFSEELF